MERFDGWIAGLGTAAGLRVVIGHWPTSPLGAFTDAMVERPDGHRILLAPDERAGKAYALLAETMARTGKAGLGSFVMRSHEYLVAILADGGVLRAEVLRYANELRTPETVGLPKVPAKPTPSLVNELAGEIDKLTEKALDLNEMEDLEAEALRKFAERKAKAGNGVISSLSLFETLEQGTESTKIVTAWIRDENLNAMIPNEPKITNGQVVVHSDRVLVAA